MRKRLAVPLVLVTLATVAGLRADQTPSPTILAASPFETYLEQLRQQANIPGISGAILHDGQLVWERGFGFQNVESRVRATPDTPYLIADLSQTFAAVLLLQCVEQRWLELDAPLARYGVDLPETGATMRHVMSHTSGGTPGETFKYDLDRYARLSDLVERCAPQPYRKSVAHRLLERLAMTDSVPGRDLQDRNVVPEEMFTPAALDRYARTLERLAVPYRTERRGRLVRSEMPPVDGINAATGLVSTVRDLARFDAALGTTLLLREETLALAWTNAPGGFEGAVPTGLGWFVQTYRNERIVWHFGVVPNAYSALIVKVPARKLTLILLANSDGLVAPFQLSAGDVTRSLFATLFLRLFV